MVELIAYCHEIGLPVLLKCDANPYYTIWGSTDTNARGEALLQYLARTDLMILNRGNDLTFVNAVWRDYSDLTLGVSSSSVSRREAQQSLPEIPGTRAGSCTGPY